MQTVLNQKVFRILSEVAQASETEVYLVGGCVRDMMLQRDSKDIDVMVIGNGLEYAQKVAEHINRPESLKVFKNFGTAMLHMDTYDVEFVGARKESYRTESRKPIVENGSFEDDIFRRDFTINALTISLNKDNHGEIRDITGGINDLQNKLIRTPRPAGQTFSDDPLRMLRAIRFATQLGFSLHKDVSDGIMANKNRLEIISSERIADELSKILMAPIPSTGFKYLSDTGLLDVFFPELTALKGVEIINGKGHKDNFYHTLMVLDNVAQKSPDIWLRWAALLHDIAKPKSKRFSEKDGWTFHGHEFLGEKMIPAIFKRLRLPLNENMKFVQKLVRLHLRPIVLVEDVVTDSAVRRLLFEAGNDVDALMLLCEADITSKNETKVKKFLNNFKIVKRKLVEIEEKDKIREFQPPVSGEEIMEVFNLQPSREVGIIKNAIKNAIIEGHIKNDYKEACDFMMRFAASINVHPSAK